MERSKLRNGAPPRTLVAAFARNFRRGMRDAALVATLKTLGHQHLASELAKSVGPLAILGGSSVSEIVERVLGSLPVGVKASVAEVVKNGKTLPKATT